MIEVILEPNTPREEKTVVDKIIYHKDGTCTLKVKNRYKKVNKMYEKLGKMNQKIDDGIVYRGYKMSQPKNHLKVDKNKA